MSEALLFVSPKIQTKQSDTGLHHQVSSAQAADIHSRLMGRT